MRIDSNAAKKALLTHFTGSGVQKGMKNWSY